MLTTILAYVIAAAGLATILAGAWSFVMLPVCKEIWRGSYSSRATDPVRIGNDLDASPFSHFEEQEVRQ